jgi:hypothetical protein
MIFARKVYNRILLTPESCAKIADEPRVGKERDDYNPQTPATDLFARHEADEGVDREWYEPWSRYGEVAQGRRLARVLDAESTPG